MSIIKVGFLVSYDFEYLKISLPRVYAHATEIYLAVDAERKTWSGGDYTIPNDFWSWIEEIDTEQKIKVYQDKFFVEGLTPMECDTRERNMLGKAMGRSDWFIQIDSDEFFEDFELFVSKLRTFSTSKPITVNCRVITLFKELSSGFLAIDGSFETLSFATNNPVYDMARNNTTGNEQVDWDDLVYHQSWARDPAAIKFKLTNWSHKDDFNTESFFNLWFAIDEYNYVYLRDFHPLHPITWPRLKWIPRNLFDILNSDETKQLRGEALVQKNKKNLFSRLWREIKEG